MRRLIVALLLVASLVGIYSGLVYVPWFRQWWRANIGWPLATTASTTKTITSSGVIEAETVAIASEVGGRIIAISADRGDAVHAGQELVRLDEELTRAQEAQALAALAAARANLAEVAAATRLESIAAVDAELAQAEQARDGARAVAQQASALVVQPIEIDVRISTAAGDVAMLEKQVESARASLAQAEVRRDELGRSQPDDQAATAYQAAIKQAEAARANAAAVEAQLAGAREQLSLLYSMRANPVASLAQLANAQADLGQAEAAVVVAQARLDAAKAGALGGDLAVAEAQVRQAEAAVNRVAVQLNKAVVIAPLDGIVLERAAEPGEVAQAGATLLTLGNLDRVTLTVYVPETRIGRLSVGMPALVSVDAYPGEAFAGTVSFIALEAEFTPKNVQTREERANLVFAVRIDLPNLDHRLKPGMPGAAAIGE